MHPLLRKSFFYSGVSLLLAASVLAFSQLLGFVTLPEFFMSGDSPLHMIGRLAVAGCVLAAIGSVE